MQIVMRGQDRHDDEVQLCAFDILALDGGVFHWLSTRRPCGSDPSFIVADAVFVLKGLFR
jgi:hypothetical protein